MKKRIILFFLMILSVIAGITASYIYTANDSISLHCLKNALTVGNISTDIDLTDGSARLKDMEYLGDNRYLSMSSDPYIVIVWDAPRYIENVELELYTDDSDNTTACQVFYGSTAKDKFAEEASVIKTVSKGKYNFKFTAGNYQKLRFDLTNESGTVVTIDQVKVYSSYGIDEKLQTFFFAFAVLFTALLVFISFFAVCDKFRTAITAKVSSLMSRTTPQRGFLMLMSAAVLITDAAVYINLALNDKTVIYNSDMGSDTLFQYYPVYTYVVNAIKSGDISSLIYSLNIGYGTDFGNFSGNVCTPLTFLGVILPSLIFGTDALPAALILYRILCSLTAGIVCYFYLKCFSDKYAVNAAVSYIFSFNGFYMIWGQHFFFSEYCIYALLVLICIEKFLQRDNRFFVPLAAVSFLCMSFSVYLSYMVFLPAAVYAIIRYFMIKDKPNVKHFVCKFAAMAVQILAGFGCAMFIALSNIMVILGSGRVTTGSETKLSRFLSLLTQWNFSETSYRLQRTISSGLLGRGHAFGGPVNYYGAVQLFFSAFTVIIIVQYLFTLHRSEKSLKNKILCYLSLALCFCAVMNKGIGFAMYAFSGIQSRQLFILFPFIAIITAEVINNAVYRKIFSKTGFVIGLVISLLAIFSGLRSGKTDNVFGLLIIMILIVGSVLILAGLKTRNVMAGYALCLLLMANVSGEMIYAVNRLGNVKMSDLKNMLSDVQRTEEVLDCIAETDSDLYRTDKTYRDVTMCNESFIEGYNPVSFYNSTTVSRLDQFLHNYPNPKYFFNGSYAMPYFIKSENDYILYSQLGLKYILSKKPLANDAVLELADVKNDIYIYKNKYVNSFTTFFDNAVSYSDFEKLDYCGRNTLLQCAVITDDDSGIPEKYLRSADMFDTSSDITEAVLTEDAFESLQKLTESGGQAVLELDPHRNSDSNGLYAEISLIAEKDMNASVTAVTSEETSSYYPISLKGGREQSIRYILPNSTQRLEVDIPANCTVNYFRITSNGYPVRSLDNPVSFDYTGNDTDLKGHITCDRDGLLFIPLVYSDNFEITVDNVPVTIYKANTAFMCIEMPEGEHSIGIRYIPYQRKSAVISIVSLAFCAAYYLLTNRKKNAA